MILKHKWKIIISSAVILLPILFGFIFYNQLPDDLLIHWGVSGEADSSMPKPLAIVLPPFIMLAVHLLCIFLSLKLDKRHEQSEKIYSLFLSLIPIISTYISIFIYSTALGVDFEIKLVIGLLFATIFTLIGNYMPKSTRGMTFGYKLPWTLANDDNWNATHRYAGYVSFAAGIAFAIISFLPDIVFFIGAVICIALIFSPVLYSYLYYKRAIKEGRATPEDYKLDDEHTYPKRTRVIRIVVVSLVIILVAFMMFLGEVKAEVGEDAVTISATFTPRVTYKYSDIDEITLVDDFEAGFRTIGFGSMTICSGNFKNNTIGEYISFRYARVPTTIVIKMGDEYIAVNASDIEATEELYNELSSKINN